VAATGDWRPYLPVISQYCAADRNTQAHYRYGAYPPPPPQITRRRPTHDAKSTFRVYLLTDSGLAVGVATGCHLRRLDQWQSVRLAGALVAPPTAGDVSFASCIRRFTDGLLPCSAADFESYGNQSLHYGKTLATNTTEHHFGAVLVKFSSKD